MAKRFTDTGKWKKDFIKSLPAKMKLLWFYILDDCDHAGIWEVDLEVASLRIGEPITYEEAFTALGRKIRPIGKAKWFIEDFIFFQYGELKESNRMHLSVLSILKKYGIQRDKPLISPFQGVKEQYKEQVQGNGQGEGKGTTPPDEPEVQPTTREEIQKMVFAEPLFLSRLQDSHPGKDYEKAFSECYAYFMNRPNPPNMLWVWRQKLMTWLSNMKQEAPVKQAKKKVTLKDLQ
jgi:hypothetical protein